MPRPRVTRLPKNLHTGLSLVERGHFIRSGGTMPTGKLPQIVLDLFQRLDEAEIEWVMVGAEGINLYLKRPRATVDVDLVVRKKHLAKAKKVVRGLCGEVKDTEVHFKAILSPEPNLLELDVIKSQSHPLFEAALDHRVEVGGVPVPRIEAILALKYLSAVSPWRKHDDKMQDAVDFERAYKDNQARIDRPLLIDLAAKAHKNARKEFEKFLGDLDAGRPITI